MSEAGIKISFIVVTYKRRELLQKCLDSIYMQINLPRPYEIIIVDNGGDAKFKKSADPEIEFNVISPKTNLGVTGGRNEGMRHAKGRYWFFIDDDAWWHQTNDAARLVEYLDANPKCGALAFKSLDLNGNIIESELSHPDKAFLSTSKQPVAVPYFYGGLCVLNGEAIKCAGNYPERFFYGMEEPDLSLRLIDAGYVIHYLPYVAVYHARSNQGRTAGAKYWHNMTLNKSRMAWRLLPLPYPLTILVAWSLKTLLVTHQPKIVFDIWRSLWAERRLLSAERKPIKPETIAYLKRIGARLLY
jgi:GT2 family glycosyltransferase